MEAQSLVQYCNVSDDLNDAGAKLGRSNLIDGGNIYLGIGRRGKNQYRIHLFLVRRYLLLCIYIGYRSLVI